MIHEEKYYKLCGEHDGSKIYVRPGFESLCQKLTRVQYSNKDSCVRVYTKLPVTGKLYVLIKSLFSLSKPNFNNPIAVVIDKDLNNPPEDFVCKEYEINLDKRDVEFVVKANLPLIIAIPLIEPVRVLKFLLVGAVGSIVNLAVAQSVFNMLTKVDLLNIIRNPVASASGFESSVLFNFVLHERWTFRDSEMKRDLRSVLTRMIKYHAASLTSLSSQILLATILPITIGLKFWIAQLIGITVGFALNFILGYVYTWSRRSVRGN